MTRISSSFLLVLLAMAPTNITADETDLDEHDPEVQAAIKPIIKHDSDQLAQYTGLLIGAAKVGDLFLNYDDAHAMPA